MGNTGYFKGWYFKCCTDDKTIAFIPAYHISNHKKSASLQIIKEDAAFCIPFDTLEYREKPLYVKIGNCVFSEKGMVLNVQTDSLELEGSLQFGTLSPIDYDIMGPFRWVPFMQCRHRIYSMFHKINGQIRINGEDYIFNDTTGYIEGDRGRSFPNRYIWTQCCFGHNSLMLSVADIPLGKFHFTGIIGVVFLNRKEYRIATYLGAKIMEINDNTVRIKQGKWEITAKLLENNAYPLLAPAQGNMCRTIHETPACKAYYKVTCGGKPLCEFTTDKASFEFEY